MVSGPEISRFIEQFEYENQVKADFCHHKETEANQTSFLTNVKQFTRTLDELGIPFNEETKDLIILDSKEIVDIKVSESHSNLVKLGMEQYERFAKVMSDGRASFYDPLRRNKLPLFSRKPTTYVSTSKYKRLSPGIFPSINIMLGSTMRPEWIFHASESEHTTFIKSKLMPKYRNKVRPYGHSSNRYSSARCRIKCWCHDCWWCSFD